MSRNMSQLGRDLHQKSNQVRRGVESDIPRYVGEMLVDEFRESFDLQRFNDYGEEKWKDVKRRSFGSRWYGFESGTNGRVPIGARGYHSSGKPRRYGTRGGTTNFSQRATTRGILRGKGSIGLQESIYLKSANSARVVVATDRPYAEVHNEGGDAYIFGRKKFKMPKRQFMGHSRRSDEQAKIIIDKYFSKIL